MAIEQLAPDDARGRAALVRRETIRLVGIAKSGHYTSVFSCAEILGVLYSGVLRLSEDPDWPDRDRLILSKGHVAVGLYPLLAERGYIARGRARLSTPGSATRSATTPTCAASRASTSRPARSATASRSGSAWRGGEAARPRRGADLGAARRPGAQRGAGLGGGAGRARPLRARQPLRDRRPQRDGARRHDRGDAWRSSRSPGKLRGVRLGGRSSSTATTSTRCDGAFDRYRAADRRRPPTACRQTPSRARGSAAWRVRRTWHLGYLGPRPTAAIAIGGAARADD